MKIQPPPGMRDFYPEDMRLENWLFDQWRAVSRAFGFSEYEGPIFEYLDLYRLKSGQEIVSELFHFTDRGQRELAIRPEMTPTLARMVAARAGSLPRPIKWFSIPRMCRAEKPQRGRLREFFQWNADILGVDDPLADAEIVAVAVEFLRRVGLTPQDVVVEINNRALAGRRLEAIGVPADQVLDAFELLDRFDRLPPEEFRQRWERQFGAAAPYAKLESDYLQTEPATPEAAEGRAPAGAGRGDGEDQAIEPYLEFRANLARLGVWEYCRDNPRLVRGLAYYTGNVFEIRDRAGRLRALAGGGRYDNLTEMLEGPRVPGVGFGMGDAPVLELLRELGRLPQLTEQLDLFVIDADPSLFARALEIVGRLRRAGLAVDFSYRRQPLGKQLRTAAARNARYAVIVGSELTERGELTIKNLQTGRQQSLPVEHLLRHPQAVMT